MQERIYLRIYRPANFLRGRNAALALSPALPIQHTTSEVMVGIGVTQFLVLRSTRPLKHWPISYLICQAGGVSRIPDWAGPHTNRSYLILVYRNPTSPTHPPRDSPVEGQGVSYISYRIFDLLAENLTDWIAARRPTTWHRGEKIRAHYRAPRLAGDPPYPI